MATVIDDIAAADGTLGGTVAPGFEGVQEAFADNFREHGEVGAAVAVYVDGRKVVDIWGGVADRRSGRSYQKDTLQLVFSSTKGITALCANLLAQQGLLDVDAPVAHYWPEFAANGKGGIPVRWLLSHQGGLPYIGAPLSLEQLLAWDPAVEALAAQAPVWEPGTAHGYHAITYGWLVGEVIRRVTGESVGRLVADRLAGPLGLEMWIGLPDDQQERVAPLTMSGTRRPTTPVASSASTDRGEHRRKPQGSDLARLVEQILGPDSLLIKALDGAPGIFTQPGMFNRPDVRAAELPAANGVTNARSLAKLYAATIGPVEDADGVGGVGGAGPLLKSEQLAAAIRGEVSGPDKVLMVATDFGLGYMLSGKYSAYGGARAFGHSGAGGSVGFADPDNGIGLGYTMNRMMYGFAGDPRTRGLVRAVYAAIGVEPTFA